MATGKLMVEEHIFGSRAEASQAAAGHIAAALRERLEIGSSAAIVVSGGTSPVACFEALAESPLPWRNIKVLLSDERWVDDTHADSNARLVNTKLLTGKAANGKLLGIYDASATPESRTDELNEAFPSLPLPLACSLLGMGEDGHFASLFPDADQLPTGLALDNDAAFLTVKTAASPYTRISMSLSALCNATSVALLFFGEAKKAVYDRALAGGSGLPVERLIKQDCAPVHLFWAE